MIIHAFLFVCGLKLVDSFNVFENKYEIIFYLVSMSLLKMQDYGV